MGRESGCCPYSHAWQLMSAAFRGLTRALKGAIYQGSIVSVVSLSIWLSQALKVGVCAERTEDCYLLWPILKVRG